MNSDEIKFSNNEPGKQFLVHTQGAKGRIEYEKPVHNHLELYHTEIDQELKGQGIASVLVKRALEYCQANNWKVTPTCTYVAAYIHRHPEFQHLVAGKPA